MVISTSNLVGIIDVGVNACGIILNASRSNKAEVEIWRTFKILNAKINVKRRQIAEILHTVVGHGCLQVCSEIRRVIPLQTLRLR